MANIYALLVGVNSYDPESNPAVPSLKGCENDIIRWESFLKKNIPENQLHLVPPLLNKDATYKNVVDHFGEKFLLKAEAEDIVLFVFSGHGSREETAPEFLPYYPDGFNETLVLYDSRKPGGLDLADKELAILIERISSKGVDVIVILDNCHSGSGTRVIDDFEMGAVRQTSQRIGSRPLAQYLDREYLHRDPLRFIPRSRHLLIAACSRKEQAREIEDFGLFTSEILSILEVTGGKLSYAELFSRCHLELARKSDHQHPQFEPYGLFNGYGGFLGLTNATQGTSVKIFYEKGNWQVNRGAINLLPLKSDLPASFEIWEDEQVLGQVETDLVGFETSSLKKPDFPLDTAKAYTGIQLSFPLPKLLIEVSGNESKISELSSAMTLFQANYFSLAPNLPTTPYYLYLDSDSISLYRRSDNLCLRKLANHPWDEMYADIFSKLEHMAKWEYLIALDNHNSKIKRQLIELELWADGKMVANNQNNEVVIDIVKTENGYSKVPFELKLVNRDKGQYFGFLCYSNDHFDFTPFGFNELIDNGKNITVFGDEFTFNTEKNESLDIFKMFISRRQISGDNIHLAELDLDSPSLDSGRTKDLVRDIKKEDINDWFAITLKVRCVAKEFKVSEHDVVLAKNRIQIAAHPHFRAGLALSNISPSTRSLDPLGIIVESAQRAGLEILNLDQYDQGLLASNALELVDIEYEESLVEHPLQIEISANLQENEEIEELILPITFDGENYIPVGVVESIKEGKAKVQITHLPETFDPRKRSLGKALKLCFLKLSRLKKQVQYLCWVDYSGEEFVLQSEGINDKVAKAQNILLLIHGIIGNTKTMAKAVQPLYDQGVFDLMLTFDYENLHTRIETTAGRLADLLNQAGINADSGKKITILAHSMGGLVSRHFIEQLNGRLVVNQLIMAGTPNRGSNVAKATTHRDNLIILLTIALATPWAAASLAIPLAILKATQFLSPTLQQMDEEDDSEFLKNLARTSDPGVKYYAIGGNLFEYLDKNPEVRKLMDKLFKLGSKFLYGKEPNDIVVSVKSVQSIPLNRQPEPTILEVGCHHLNYFQEEESLGEIFKILKN